MVRFDWGLAQQRGPWKQTRDDVANAKRKHKLTQGGGIPAGGTEHSGHGGWYASIFPIAPKGYLPSPPTAISVPVVKINSVVTPRYRNKGISGRNNLPLSHYGDKAGQVKSYSHNREMESMYDSPPAPNTGESPGGAFTRDESDVVMGLPSPPMSPDLPPGRPGGRGSGTRARPTTREEGVQHRYISETEVQTDDGPEMYDSWSQSYSQSNSETQTGRPDWHEMNTQTDAPNDVSVGPSEQLHVVPQQTLVHNPTSLYQQMVQTIPVETHAYEPEASSSGPIVEEIEPLQIEGPAFHVSGDDPDIVVNKKRKGKQPLRSQPGWLATAAAKNKKNAPARAKRGAERPWHDYSHNKQRKLNPPPSSIPKKRRGSNAE